MSAPVTIKVLQGLALAMGEAKQRHLLKALETFCVIKSMYVNRPMPVCSAAGKAPAALPQAVQDIAELSLRSTKTIKRRIQLLTEEKWLRMMPDGLHAISWETLRAQYGIKHYRFYHLKPCKAVQLEYLIKARIFAEKKLHCKLGYKAHLLRAKNRAEIIRQVSGSLNSEVVAEHQLNNFLSEGKLYDSDSAYALSLRYTKRDQTHLHGDLEINYETTTRIFGYQSWGGAAYMKRTLQKKGVIEVETRAIELAKGKHGSKDSRKTRLGFVWWSCDTKRLLLLMPDKVNVIPNAHVDGFHALKTKWNAEMNNRLNGAGAQQ